MERFDDTSDEFRSDQAIEWLARLRASDVTAAEKAEFANWLAEDARTRLEAQSYPLLFRKDIGRYVLALALLPLLLLFRRDTA